MYFSYQLIREFIHRLVGDGDDVGRRIQIDLLPFFKTVDYITLRIVHFCFCLGCRPEEVVTIRHPELLHLTRLLWSLVIDEGHERLECRGEVVVVLKFVSEVSFIAHHSSRIPQAATCNIGQIALQLELSCHLIDGGIVDIARTNGAFHILSDDQRTTIGVA